jgi:predicted nuclease with TOPRIM domain
MEKFKTLASIENTNEKLEEIHKVLSKLDDKYNKKNRELTEQVWALENIIDKINMDDKDIFSKEIEAIKKEMSELDES